MTSVNLNEDFFLFSVSQVVLVHFSDLVALPHQETFLLK